MSAQASPELNEETFVSLESLSRKAADDSLASKGGHLTEDQFDSLAVHLLGIGIRAFERFDSELTVSDRDGFSFAYRSMRGYRDGRFTEGPYIDWLRTNVRDKRFEPAGSTSVTESGELPETPTLAAESFDQAIRDASHSLSNGALWTLHHLARPLAESGTTMVDLALQYKLQIGEVRRQLTELRAELSASTSTGTPTRVGEKEAT